MTGNDLLLLNESKDHIVQAARLADFDEKQEVSIANDTKWEDLFEAAQSNGLFFNRQIIILNLPEAPTAAQMKNVAELCRLSHADLLLILCLPKFSKTMENKHGSAKLKHKLCKSIAKHQKSQNYQTGFYNEPKQWNYRLSRKPFSCFVIAMKEIY
ncbi:DNA polymerase III subunit delta [Actinobacillus equuli]|nr:DNA polymerase III subunit delta [Actinobacillus equuli]